MSDNFSALDLLSTKGLGLPSQDSSRRTPLLVALRRTVARSWRLGERSARMTRTSASELTSNGRANNSDR